MINIWNDLIWIFETKEITLGSGIFRLLLSLCFGAIIGIERQQHRNAAGFRTFSLISMGACLAMLVSIWMPQSYPNFLNGDPSRIAAQVLTGIGFLGAGAIIQDKGNIKGLTTAASIWMMAMIGLAVGAGMFLLALFTTLLILFTLIILEKCERQLLSDGIQKSLIIHFSDEFIDFDKIPPLLHRYKIHVQDISYDYALVQKMKVMTYTIYINRHNIHIHRLFSEIEQLGHIERIQIGK